MLQAILQARKPGASIIPVIVSTDPTQDTLFGNKRAYPVYLTIGNIPKTIRCKPSWQGQILLAYLPMSKLKFITNKAARQCMLINIYHVCLQCLLLPLIEAGIEGLPMSDGMGTMRRVHPILAIFVSNYPEQVLATGTKSTECPKCDIPSEELGNSQALFNLRDIYAVHNALFKSFREFARLQRCMQAGSHKANTSPILGVITLC